MKERLNFLVTKLKNESLLSIAWADCTAESEVINKFRYFIKQFRENSDQQKGMSHLAEIAERVEFRILEIEKGNNLSKRFEIEASKALLEKVNFKVLEGTCTIKIKNLMEEYIKKLDTKNPGHQPIIEYLNLYDTIQQRLIRQKKEFEEVITKLEDEFENRQKQIELDNEELSQDLFKKEQDFELARKDLEEQHSLQITKKKQEFAEEKREMEISHSEKLSKLESKLKKILDDQAITESRLENERNIALKKIQDEKELEEYELEGLNAIKKTELDSINKLKAEKQKFSNQLEMRKLEGKQKADFMEVQSLEVETFEKEVELLQRENDANNKKHDIELDDLNRINDIEKAEITNESILEVEKIDSELKILEKRKEIPTDLKEIRYSLEEIQELKSAEAKLEIQKIDHQIQQINNDTNKLKLDYEREAEVIKHISRVIAHQLQRELKLDEHNFKLTEKGLERELLLNYTKLNADEKLDIIESLGKNVSESLKSANWLNPDLKIISMPGAGSGVQSVNQIQSFLQGTLDTFFKSSPWLDLINEALQKNGINWFNSNKNENSKKSDTINNTEKFEAEIDLGKDEAESIRKEKGSSSESDFENLLD